MRRILYLSFAAIMATGVAGAPAYANSCQAGPADVCHRDANRRLLRMHLPRHDRERDGRGQAHVPPPGQCESRRLRRPPQRPGLSPVAPFWQAEAAPWPWGVALIPDSLRPTREPGGLAA